MTYYFCLVSKEDSTGMNAGLNIGRKYAYANRSKWVQAGNEISSYLTSGYTNGVDLVVYQGKAYYIKKSYIDLEENFVVLVCKESFDGCDK